MEKSNTVKCKSCGQEISKQAVICPGCGAKVKKPIFKKWWFWVIIGVLAIGAIAAGSGNKETAPAGQGAAAPAAQTAQGAAAPAPAAQTTESKKIEYTPYDCKALFDDLKNNALRAEQTHQDEYVEITGYIRAFDSDGKYISIGAPEDDFNYLFDTILCDFKNDTQKEIAMQMNKYDKITIRGQIKSIGEVLGYSLNIDEIVK